LVEAYIRPLPSYFAGKKYSLPSLVEVVMSALAELFCLSEFIVSLRLVETIKRTSSSYFAGQNHSFLILVRNVMSALAKLCCLFD